MMSPADGNPPATDLTATRRSYLGWLVGLCSAGVGAVLALPLIRFSLYPLRVQTREVKWSDAGPVSDFNSLSAPAQRSITVEQVDGWRKAVSEKVVYVTHGSSGQLQVLSAVCPHLGCSLQWRDSKHEFECPCHAAAFAPDGSKLGGPAPRGMDSLETQIQNGHLMVRYQYFRQLVPTKEIIG
jgi:menaquinol-cytochrome c reductase iron-sulfur subunit